MNAKILVFATCLEASYICNNLHDCTFEYPHLKNRIQGYLVSYCQLNLPKYASNST